MSYWYVPNTVVADQEEPGSESWTTVLRSDLSQMKNIPGHVSPTRQRDVSSFSGTLSLVPADKESVLLILRTV